MRKIIALTIALLMHLGCAAQDDVGDSTPPTHDAQESRVIGEVNGLPVVSGETLPFTADVAAESGGSKSTNDPFLCINEQGHGCNWPWRSSNSFTKFNSTHLTDVYPYGEGGEGSSLFDIRNSWGYRYITPDHPATASVQWQIDWPEGSTCKTYGNCKYFICLAAGTAWPRCFESLQNWGGTNEFSGDPWPGTTWKTFVLYYQIVGGPAVMATTGHEWLWVFHTPF